MPDKEDQGRQMRRHPRISWGFLIWHKPHDEAVEWTGFSTVKNISVGGCYFGSPKTYPPGKILDLRVKLPGVKDPLLFQGEVKRSDSGEASGVWFVAVEFINMGTAQKDEFNRVISFFIKKQNHQT